MHTLARWLTNSGCVPQALSSLTHSSTVRQPIECPSNYSQIYVLLRRRTSRNIATSSEAGNYRGGCRRRSSGGGKPRTMSRVDDWTHMRSKMNVRRKNKVLVGHGGVRVLHWCGSTGAKRTQTSCLVCTEVRHKRVEPTFGHLRVLLSVACQEDVFRLEDPCLITTAETSTSDCQTRTPRQSSQACVGNCERRCTVLWMLPNVGENTMLRFGRREDFPEAQLLRATSSMKACEHTFWCMVTIFHSGPT